MNRKTWKQFRGRERYFHLKYGQVVLLTLFLVLVISANMHAEELSREWEVHIISAQKQKKLMEKYTENQELLETHQASIWLNGVELPRDRSENCYYLVQNLDKEDWEGIFTTNSDSVKLYLVQDEYLQNKQKAIEEGHRFQLLLQKGQEYARAGLVVTGMPVISMDTEYSLEPDYEEDDIDNFVFNSDTRYYGNITIYHADGSSGTYQAPELRPSPLQISGKTAERLYEELAQDGCRVVQHRVCYHGRGATSAGFEKKGYALKLLDEQNEKVAETLFQLGTSYKWKLLPIPADHYKIREKTAWQLWAEMAETAEGFSEYTSGAEYCELILDGDYRGIYLLIKTFDEHSLGLEKEDILYKIIQAEMPEKDEIIASIEQGYAVCYPIRMRYPELGELSMEQAWEPMRHYLEVALWHTDFQAYGEAVELENLIDYMIFLETVSGSDNARKNTYMVADKQENGGYKMLTLPWDLDNTFGNHFDNRMEIGKTLFVPDASLIYTEGVTRQLFLNNEHGEKDRLVQKWKAYRQDILSDEHILDLMQRNMDYMVKTGAFARDEKKWPEFGHTRDLTEIADYQKERMAFLDEYFTK